MGRGACRGLGAALHGWNGTAAAARGRRRRDVAWGQWRVAGGRRTTAVPSARVSTVKMRSPRAPSRRGTGLRRSRNNITSAPTTSWYCASNPHLSSCSVPRLDAAVERLPARRLARRRVRARPCRRRERKLRRSAIFEEGRRRQGPCTASRAPGPRDPCRSRRRPMCFLRGRRGVDPGLTLRGAQYSSCSTKTPSKVSAKPSKSFRRSRS